MENIQQKVSKELHVIIEVIIKYWKETDGIQLDTAKNSIVNSKSTPDNLKAQQWNDETDINQILYKKI